MSQKKPGEADHGKTLRQRAEAMLRTTRTDVAGMAAKDVQSLEYELQVHQMELEILKKELRYAQMELAESRDRNSDLFEFAPVGYLKLDKHDIVIKANLTAAALLGVERQDLIGRKVTDFVAREAQDAFHVHRQAVCGGDEKQVVELAMLQADGTPMAVRFKSARRIGPGETEATWRTALIDITDRRHANDELRQVSEEFDQRVTERKRAERALHSSEERLRAVLNTAIDAIINIDRRGIITEVNPATERLFGYTRQELVGHNVNMLMPSPYHEEHDQYLANYLRTGKAKIIGIGREVVARRKDGSTFPIDLAISEVDHLGLFTGIIRDISERKQLERHLAESRIDEQRHLAQELHDGLGGLMTGIGMLAKMLHLKLQQAASPLVDEAAELLKHIRDGHEQLRRFSRGILPVEVMPDGLQAALCELAERTNKGDKLVCDFECEGNVGIHSPDHAIHLYRIAQEAVSNAVRHGRPTRISIGMEGTDGVVTLVIKDNGVGIQESTDSHKGIGLRTMTYRANQIGAVLTVEPVDSGGTVVRCVYRNEPAH